MNVSHKVLQAYRLALNVLYSFGIHLGEPPSLSAASKVQLVGGVHVVFPTAISYSFTSSLQFSSSSTSFHSSYSGPKPFHLIRYSVLVSFLRSRLIVRFLTMAPTSHSASGSSAAHMIGGGGGAVLSNGSSSFGAGSK